VLEGRARQEEVGAAARLAQRQGGDVLAGGDGPE
jgi:hypothetical protein